MSVRPDLFRRLREGTEVLRTGGGAKLYAGECDAVLNLIEAADKMERALRFIAEHPGCPNGLHEVAADAAAEGKSAVAPFVEEEA